MRRQSPRHKSLAHGKKDFSGPRPAQPGESAAGHNQLGEERPAWRGETNTARRRRHGEADPRRDASSLVRRSCDG